MKYGFFILVAVFLSISACGGSIKMKSDRPTREIVIDGKYEDWQGKLTYMEDHEAAVGVHNDQDFLYLCFTTQNRATLRKAMGLGLTVWFDPAGGSKKEFGIKFPLGLAGTRFGGMRRGSDGDEGERERLPMPTELEIISSGQDEPVKFGLAEIDGLEVSLGEPRDGFVYELKIPLNKTETFRYAIEPGDKKSIGVGIETSKPDLDRLREERGGFGGQRPPGEMGGPLGGFGGRGGGFGGRESVGERAKLFEQFKLWLQVDLN